MNILYNGFVLLEKMFIEMLPILGFILFVYFMVWFFKSILYLFKRKRG